MEIKLTNGASIELYDLLNKIAAYLYVETASNTNSNNWTHYFDEIEETFCLPAGFLLENPAICELIISRLTTVFLHQIASVEIYEADEQNKAFDVTLYDSFVLGYTQEDACLIWGN